MFSTATSRLKLGFVQIYMTFTVSFSPCPASNGWVKVNTSVNNCVLTFPGPAWAAGRTEAHVEVLATKVANLIFLPFH